MENDLVMQYVQLPRNVMEALRLWAKKEKRTAKAQAEFIIEQAVASQPELSETAEPQELKSNGHK